MSKKLDEKTQAELDRAVRALLGMGEVPHRREKYTKEDLKRKFRKRIDRKEKGRIEEV